MQTPLIQTTLPNSQIQVEIQPENEDATNLAQEKNIEYFKKIVRNIGKATIILSIFVCLLNIVEFFDETCIREVSHYQYDDYLTESHQYPYQANAYTTEPDYLNHPPTYTPENDDISCTNPYTTSAGIWCSVLPFLTGVFGILAGSKSSSSQKKNALLMGFSIVGASALFIVMFYQSVLTELYRLGYAGIDFKYGLKISILCITGINFILLIVSSAYSCCLCKSCCGQSVKIVEQQVIYVPYDPNQQDSVQQKPVFFNQQQETNVSQPNQHVPTVQNPDNIPPPQYDQLNSQTQI